MPHGVQRLAVCMGSLGRPLLSPKQYTKASQPQWHTSTTETSDSIPYDVTQNDDYLIGYADMNSTFVNLTK